MALNKPDPSRTIIGSAPAVFASPGTAETPPLVEFVTSVYVFAPAGIELAPAGIKSAPAVINLLPAEIK
ncbi:MAG: hypothetical protein WDN26_18630 [Chitinophagaceae bacterium]